MQPRKEPATWELRFLGVRKARYATIRLLAKKPRALRSADRHAPSNASRYLASSFLNTDPLCITKRTRSSSVMSFSGSPETATISA